ncbi:MAG: spore maturation protein [Clostridia bacterium]|nr:spore maturation protein [Clostridia bacterium]
MKLLSAASALLPALILLISALLAARRCNAFDAFAAGAEEGIGMLKRLLPTLCGLLCATAMLRASGLPEAIAALLRPITEPLGIPEACVTLFLLRPFSGSASLALAKDCMSAAGVDSFAGRVAAVLMSASETTLYTAAVYSAAAGRRVSRYVILCGLAGDLAAMVFSVLCVRGLQ